MVLVATQIRTGMILVIDNELYRVTWTMHRTPGKGNACMQTKLKHIINGKNLEKRFMSNEKVEKALLTTKDMQYLYQEADDYIFMDSETFEQYPLNRDVIGDVADFLQEGSSYSTSFHESRVVGVELPQSLDFKVTMAPPDIKRASATSTLKQVELENGMMINVPGFIKEGDIIRINPDSREYIERA